MKYIFLFYVIALLGCAATTETLLEEAKKCVDDAAVANSVQSDTGIVIDATDEQRDQCWERVNRRVEAQEKRQQERAEGKCPKGQVAWCDRRYGPDNCGCVDRWRAIEALRREGIL